MTRTNEFGQPIGDDLAGWTPPGFPDHRALHGPYASLVPLSIEDHAADLFAAFAGAPDSLWTYLAWGPLTGEGTAADLITFLDGLPDWLSYAVLVDGRLRGIQSYLRIDPAGGAIEIGGIAFSPALQRTRASTDAIRLLIAESFDMGYRRCEWKCDDLNEPSIAAAKRFGFRYEGTFRKATHYRGRNRDTAWFAITDEEWPTVRSAFDAWLDPSNFDEQGQQRKGLAEIRSELGVT